MTILLAEDDPCTRRVAQVALRRAGYRVTAVADGKAALEQALGRELLHETRTARPHVGTNWCCPAADRDVLYRRFVDPRRAAARVHGSLLRPAGSERPGAPAGGSHSFCRSMEEPAQQQAAQWTVGAGEAAKPSTSTKPAAPSSNPRGPSARIGGHIVSLPPA